MASLITDTNTTALQLLAQVMYNNVYNNNIY